MGCFGILKTLMIIFNFIISLCGAVMLSLGIWVIVDRRALLQFLGPFVKQILKYAIVGYIIAGSGAVLTLLGLLGSCSAHKENKCLLMTFFSTILVIFIAVVGGAAALVVYYSLIEGIFKEWATTTLKEDYGTDEVATKLWNGIMTTVKCCGYNNHTDFVGSQYSSSNSNAMPLQCCLNSGGTCTLDTARTMNVPGCFNHILKLAMKNIQIIAGIGGGLCGLQVSSMIVSIYMFTQLDKRFS